MDTRNTTIDPRSLNYARPLFSQLLLLLSYALLESSLPARNGDVRQIDDVCSRKENGWEPQIGGEAFTEMTQTLWEKTSPETRRAWHDTRSYLLQQDLVDDTVSTKQLRRYLCQLLWWIEQVSAQGLNALCSPSNGTDVPELLPLTEKGCIVLVCVSVSIIATPGSIVSLRSLLDDPYQHIIREMQPQLEKSPIFPNQISREELWNAFASLESIISSHTAEESTPDWTRKAVLRRGTWTQYDLSDIRSLSFASGVYATEHPGPKRAIADTACPRETAGHQRKRQRRSSSSAAKQLDRRVPLAIEYH